MKEEHIESFLKKIKQRINYYSKDKEIILNEIKNQLGFEIDQKIKDIKIKDGVISIKIFSGPEKVFLKTKKDEIIKNLKNKTEKEYFVLDIL
ncbi:hypothetical protein KC842_02425 [Candidatus Nomurabacteria bacterium]|nr:hypothetical protein [Candidatus Nomurabacteria bacterium]USN94663.1 MAG: hypothetical protein H6791_02815 [Candidatus Nomurabacteria bacterium]